MAIVQSLGALQSYGPSPATVIQEAAGRQSGYNHASPETYAAIYRTQPHVRTVVDFIARNCAQLGIHVYRRLSDIDRQRLADHELATWLTAPNDDTTGYRLIENLMQDLGIYGRAYWLKVHAKSRMQFVRIPPEQIFATGWMIPTGYIWVKPDNRELALGVNEVAFFRYFDPLDPLDGLSPLETLRKLLTESDVAHSYRRAYWANAARFEGVVERPATAPKWTPEQKQSWREQWQARFGGVANAGQMPVLEDGMTFKPTSFSAKDSEFTDARKLTREEVAAAYHVPLPMVGILDHATFSNIREQHKNLYQDCLGPSLEMVQQEIERQLLPDCDDTDRVYIEFNINDKLKGSFEEQGEAMARMVGRPVMTANEGRARLNLPSVKNDPTADQLAMPLNTGGSPYTQAEPNYRATVAPVLRTTWARQQQRLDKLGAADRAAAFNVTRWDRELAWDLAAAFRDAGLDDYTARGRAMMLAERVNSDTLHLLTAGGDPFAADRETTYA